eukprot:419920-Amphidinium_carterae.5
MKMCIHCIGSLTCLPYRNGVCLCSSNFLQAFVFVELRSRSSCFQWCDRCWLTNTSKKLSCAEGLGEGIDVDKRIVVKCLLPQLVQAMHAQADQSEPLECYTSAHDVFAEVSEVFWVDAVKTPDAWKDVFSEKVSNTETWEPDLHDHGSFTQKIQQLPPSLASFSTDSGKATKAEAFSTRSSLDTSGSRALDSS